MRSDPVVGFVGDSSSSTTIALLAATTPLNKLVVSYASTAESLSAKAAYPLFLRNVQPDVSS